MLLEMVKYEFYLFSFPQIHTPHGQYKLTMWRVLENHDLRDSEWWRRRGSNSRPYGCEPYALPAELRPQITKIL